MVLARWTAHPAKRRPRDLILVTAVVLLTSGAVLASFESLFLTGLSAVFLIVATAPFLFPTHYTVTDIDVSERRLWRHKGRQWTDIRRVQVGPSAVLVSPFARPNWLDRFRGLIILLDGADRDAVIAIMRQRVAETGADDPSQAIDAES